MFDGVLYQFSKTAQYMIAMKEGLATREELPWDDSTWDCGRPKEDWDWVLAYPQTEWVFRHGHLWSGAVEFVYDLAELGDIVLVTKRPSHATKVTIDWIRYTFDHEPFPFKEIHILGDDRKKSEIPADVYIDDSIDNAEELLDNTRSLVLLMDRPWNDYYEFDEGENVIRVHSFDETLGEVGWLKQSLKKQGGSYTETAGKTTGIHLTTSPESADYGDPSLESKPSVRIWSPFVSSPSSSREKSTGRSETTESISQDIQRRYR